MTLSYGRHHGASFLRPRMLAVCQRRPSSRQAGEALCVRHRVAVSVWVTLLTSGAADTLELTFSAVLDKTGTLTVGSPQVTCVRVLGDDDTWMEEDTLLKLVTAAEANSEHAPGPGDYGARRRCLPRRTSQTVSAPTAKRAVRLLRPHGLTMAMLTGDKEGTARSIGGRAACRSCRRKGEVVAIVGNGINIDHPLVVASGHLSSDTNDGVHTIRQSTSVHVSEIQSIATATSSPSPVRLWHHFGEGHGFIGTMSVSASRDHHLLCRKAGSFDGVQPGLVVVVVARVPDPQPSCSRALVLAAGYGGASVWDLDKPLPCGRAAAFRLVASTIDQRQQRGVHQLRNGERVLTTYTLEQWNMTSVVIVLWSMRGWQPSLSTTPASASFESATSTRDAKHVLLYGRASRVAELQRAVRMFPATVSAAVQDAETDTPLPLLSIAANKASHVPALRASVSWLDCRHGAVCRGQADVIVLMRTFPSELALATSTADKQYNHQQRA
ncbi:hypothetical protein PTSG_00106 [Salpingoeca rosetta]|uniref:Uncharacterized protein n=1 Tax=Salpingoeca rosetta (strain ATCC 50818 / BSB-021) TaxID=946362 RepID=F2TVJ4_SALR5|nr:uncharacterized protein PTSG_00106 [Salpingoeca rosetta]EGD72090.1 hypothetical protein PTSG_00106 [Salpingoeca rosetta]|eukprot:XP_004998662.1 hypothetical protein PTSG_00106 [Salpingoeca rosetta]